MGAGIKTSEFRKTFHDLFTASAFHVTIPICLLMRNTNILVMEAVNKLMNMDITLGTWILSALPLILLFVLMLIFHWGARAASAVGMLCSIIIAAMPFGASLQLILLESAKGIWGALSILIVVWPAILIFEVAQEANAFNVIRSAIEAITANKLLQILAIGWIFVSFLQGVTGFGVPVAVVAPLLVAMGLKPVWAIAIPLMGQAWGNTFGTLAAAWNALLGQVGIEGDVLLLTALWSSIFLAILNLSTGLIICWFYGKAEGLKKGFPAVLILSLIQGGGQLLLSQVNQSLCNFLPACVSLCAIFLMGKSKWYNTTWKISDSKMCTNTVLEEHAKDSHDSGLSFHGAFLPYYVLTVMSLVILLISPVNSLLSGVKLGLPFPETTTALGFVNEATNSYSPIEPFTNPGFFLLIAAIIGYMYFKFKGCYSPKSEKKILKRMIEKAVPSTLTILGLVVMSKVMSGSGQIVVLARGTAAATGQMFGLITPLIGLLGTFVTGSNVSSNILFAQFQQGISELLGKSEYIILAAQTAGASIGSMISPSKIVLACTTIGALGIEEKVMRKLLPFSVVVAFIIGGLTLVFA